MYALDIPGNVRGTQHIQFSAVSASLVEHAPFMMREVQTDMTAWINIADPRRSCFARHDYFLAEAATWFFDFDDKSCISSFLLCCFLPFIAAHASPWSWFGGSLVRPSFHGCFTSISQVSKKLQSVAVFLIPQVSWCVRLREEQSEGVETSAGGEPEESARDGRGDGSQAPGTVNISKFMADTINKNKFWKRSINNSKYQHKKRLEMTNYIQNYIQTPFFGLQKWRKPLLSQRFSIGAGNRTWIRFLWKISININVKNHWFDKRICNIRQFQ